ncbi:hypothetical protein SAMN02927937_02532 [Paenimyroides aquimaris]|uniref:Uncharacterized protein n=1 Tax=Paenimyroides marinum TaxID=1159016 RepID=A0A1H6ML87_9FLAO|nr:hypothetical protein [Paenimyroides aquimaris]SEH98368.1 hypothetical protein SAMN02927937_02532 [Paenimyroides aquimaris]
MKKLVSLLLIGLNVNCYSQTGEYISRFSGDVEYSTKSKGYYFDDITYLNIKSDKSFEIIITNYSSKNSDKNCCWKTKGTWKMNKDVLILNDEENNQTYRFLKRENNLLDIAYRKYNHLNNDELMLELLSITDLPKEENTFLENLGSAFMFEKIDQKSGLETFLKLKKQLCN